MEIEYINHEIFIRYQVRCKEKGGYMIIYKKRMAVWISCMLLALISIILPATPVLGAGSGSTHIIPIEGTIDGGNRMFVERAIQDALRADASAIVFEVNTLGGLLDPAISIKDLIVNVPVTTITWVNSRAISAGALITLAGEHVVMAPGATIGAAEPQFMSGERADEKAMSMWVAQLRGAAEIHGRDAEVAAAMADIRINIEGYSEEGFLLTLTETEAYDLGMADLITAHLSDIIAEYNLSSQVVTHERTARDQFFGFIGNPIVSVLLLIIGIAGVVIEVATAGSFGGFGVAGVLGLVLFFMGNFMSGNMGIGTVLLFLVGIVLIALEVFVIPGFGVVGVGGILALLASIILAAPNVTYGIIMLLAAIVGATIIIVFVLKNKKTRKIWNKIQLTHTEKGYSSDEGKFESFLGQEGIAVTILRPAGTVEIEGKRVDVVTAGEFIETGTKVKVVLVEGARIVVQVLHNTPKESNMQ